LESKKIVFLTGTRADFGKLKPLIGKVEQSQDLECFVFVTGMHTLSKYGSTFSEVQQQNYKNTFVFMNQTNTTDTDFILSNTITGFGNFVKEIKPDLIIIHGDRIEALSGAIVGLLNNIKTAHVEGGELSGTIDDMLRHTITKLSTIHFVSNNEAKNRLIQMGENKNAIFSIGSPDIDIMTNSNLPVIGDVKNHYNIPFENYGILIFHPVTTDLENLSKDVSEIVNAIIESNKKFIVIYPNNDPGSETIFSEYEKFLNNSNFKVFPSLRFEYFLSLLKNADFIIGNSSAGIRESVVYGIHSINIGTRQKNRTHNKNIININPIKSEILNALEHLPKSNYSPLFDFGDGQSSDRFLKIINDNIIWNLDVQKQFVDLN